MTAMVEISRSLADLLTSTERKKADPKGDMRERIAVAIRGSRPSHFRHTPSDAYTLFLYEPQDVRAMYERWADDLLRCFDHLDLEVTDNREADR